MATTTTITTPTCLVCNKASLVTVRTDQLERWVGGTVIQLAFPEMTPAERELLVTGTHEACWDRMFSEEAAG